jgi:hypothetical protein
MPQGRACRTVHARRRVQFGDAWERETVSEDEIYIGKIYETRAGLKWKVTGSQGSYVMVKRIGKARPPIPIPLRDFASLVYARCAAPGREKEG